MTSPSSVRPLSIDVTIDWGLNFTAAVTDERAESLLRHALLQEDQNGLWEIAIRFVDDQEMVRLHERYLDDPTPTDIMTFPYDPEDGGAGGDIVISVDTAGRNAADAEWKLVDELEFLILHGLLHILGWDDNDDEARAAMLEHQRMLLSSWKRTMQSC